MIAKIDLITAEECKVLVDKVLTLKEHWISRNNYYGEDVGVSLAYPDFHTLGAAAYLDGPSAHVNNNNELILRHFSDIINMVADVISKELGAPTFLDPDYACPGFHIFRGRDTMLYGTRFGGSIHLDAPHITSEFSFDFDKSRPITFTLALSMPKNGGGMNYWLEDDHLKDIKRGKTTDQISMLYEYLSPQFRNWVDVNKIYEEYKIGTLYIHDGQTLHQVANEVPTFSDDIRVTLQGHGVYRKEGLMLYL